MDTETAIKTRIEPQLVRVLGQQVANLLLTQATLQYAIADGNEAQRFESFVNAICSNERMVGMWGAEETAKQAEIWKALVKFEPGSVDEPE